MKLGLLIAIVPAVADAGHCHEVSHIVGYERCSRFGMWSHTPSIDLEVGAVALRFSPGPLDAIATSTTGVVHLTTAPGDARAIDATGGRLRYNIGFFGGYFGSEIDIAQFSDGPQLVVDASPRGGVTQSGSSGELFQGKLVVGYRHAAGPVTLGIEVAPGMRAVTFETRDGMAVRAPFQMWGLVEAHAHADVWISPHWTLGAQLSTDVLRTHDESAALTLGVHLTPFDGLR